MVVVDTSAWIEYFRNGIPEIVETVDECLERDLVGIGDLVYCEVVQGLRIKSERDKVMTLLQSLPHFDMVGFDVAEKAAENYRHLRQKGVTVRKTIDVIIGTFCAENNFEIVHNDRDFTLMAKHIDLKIYHS
jgi:predicted nucleic acid-binding protein